MARHELRTRDVSPSEAAAYLRKAQFLIKGATMAAEAGLWDSAAVSAVHATISALDALCGHHSRKRSAERDHSAALDLAHGLALPEIGLRVRAAEAVLNRKYRIEYEARPVEQGDAETIIKQAKRFVEWVETTMGPSGATSS